MNISWYFSGATNNYHVTMEHEEVFSTPDPYQRDMFIAELKARIKLIEQQHALSNESR